MPFPLFGALAFGAGLAPTALQVGSKIGSRYAALQKYPLIKSSQFGLGYGASTVVGYNIVPQFGQKSYNLSGRSTIVNKMPYGRSYSRYPSRYARYPRRYRRRYPMPYRRPAYRRRY